MCQKAPGPRCSGHAKASLAALAREVAEIQKVEVRCLLNSTTR